MSSWRTARGEIRTLSIRRRVFAECPRTVRQNPKKSKNPPCDHPANPTGWSFFDRNFLLKRFRKQEKRFREKTRKPLKTQEWKRLQREEWRIRKKFL